MSSVSSLHITAKAVSPGRSSPLVMPFYEQTAPTLGDGRALEVALARAAAHRQAATRKKSHGEHSTMIAMAQAAIGKELAGLREEVMKVKKEETPSSPPPAPSSRLHHAPPLEPRPTSANQWDSEKEEMDGEIQRLKQIEISHISKSAAVRDLESRISNYSAALHQAETRLQQQRSGIDDLKSLAEDSLRDRMKRLSDTHKLLKGHLVNAGWKNSTMTDVKALAEEALTALTQDSGVQSYKQARDRVRDYETYITQTQGTADKLIDDRLQSAKSESSSLEARLSSAEVRARHAEEELQLLRQTYESRHREVKQEAEAHLNEETKMVERQLRDKEDKIRKLQDLLATVQEEQGKHIKDATDLEKQNWIGQTKQMGEAHDAQLRKLEAVIKDLQNKLELQQHEIDIAVEKRMRSFESEKLRLEEEARTAKEILTENLEVTRERAEDKIKTLQDELSFQAEQANARADLDRKRVAEEVGRARQEAETELRNVEKAFKKYKQRSEQDTETQKKNFDREVNLAQQKVEALELEICSSNTLIEETQARCEELQNELRNKTEELELDVDKKSAQLQQAEARLIQLAQASTTPGNKGKDTQLIKADVRIQSLTDELTALKMQKGASFDALEDARKHASDLSEQLAEALSRILELEERASVRDVELQQAGARAAMLDGCLAEATSSLTAAEEHIKILTQTKSENEKKVLQAIQSASSQETRAEELAVLLREAQLKESKLLEHVRDLEIKNHETEEENCGSREQLMQLQKETEVLHNELGAIQKITNSHNETLLDSASYAERVSSLVSAIEEKEMQNIGMKKRIQEMETIRLRDDGNVKLAEMRVVELKKSLQAAKLRVPELERKEEMQRKQIDSLQLQLKEMRVRADARAAEAQAAIERAAMLEGRHKEALSRQGTLQKQVAQSLARTALLEETAATNNIELEDVNHKRSELMSTLEATRDLLRSEGEKTARLEGQISEMAAEQVHLQEGLRTANTMKERLNQKLSNASTQYGMLESRLLSAREAEKEYTQKVAAADGARGQALASRNRIVEITRELEGKIADLDTKLHTAGQENGSLGGALVMAEAEIAELKDTANRLHEQSTEQFASYTLALENREGRAAEEIQRLEGLWNKSMDEMEGMRLKLEDAAIAKGSLQGELEAVRSGATALTANIVNVESERDNAMKQVGKLTAKLGKFTAEIEQIESRTLTVASSKGELEGIVSSLKADLLHSQDIAKLANEALIDHRSQSATEKATLEGHINMLASGLQDLEYQLQVAASRSTGLEEAVKSSENETLHSIAVTSPRTVAPPDMSPI